MAYFDDNITMLLNEDKANDQTQGQLLKLVYQHLREIAFCQLRTERNNNTYNVTSLVDESFVRATASEHYQWESRRQFYAAVAKTMKRILIEHARHNLKKGRDKKYSSEEFRDDYFLDEPTSIHIVNLNEAMEELSKNNPELMEIVQLKFYVGLDMKEIADVMTCSISSIDRKWALAKAWLGTELSN